MATVATESPFERIRARPLRGLSLVLVTIIVWFAGALYCSGYEALSTGLDNWPGSLIWSAAAVVPWLALFEWSKATRGRQVTLRWANLALALAATAALSLGLEYAANALSGSHQTPVLLALLRRLPAIGASLMLILWARGPAEEVGEADQSLAELASSIDWLAAADNYVELHIGGRVVMRRMTMRQAEKALGDSGFVRIHRRYLVNRKRIAAVLGNGSKRVRMPGGTELPVGTRYGANLVTRA